MKRLLAILTSALLFTHISGCQHTVRPNVPASSPHHGELHGTLTAEPHRLLKEGDRPTPTYQALPGSVTANDQSRMDYASLQDLYVCLSRNKSNPQTHTLRLLPSTTEPRALALSQGDQLQIINETAIQQTLYLADASISSSGFQALTSLAPGSRNSVEIRLAGELELGAEEHDAIHVPVFAVENMDCQRHRSGDRYRFPNLAAGNYQLLFWYWRLGALRHQIVIEANKSLRMDETLSVDRVFQQRPPQ